MKQSLTSHPAQKPRPAFAKSPPAAKRADPAVKSGPPSPAAAPAAATAALDLHTVRLGIFNPDAREVHVAGTFNDWDPRETPLKRDSLGDWSVELSLPPGEHRYRLIVDGEWTDDPSAQRMEANPFGGFDAVIVV
jgi:hypothetical protein